MPLDKILAKTSSSSKLTAVAVSSWRGLNEWRGGGACQLDCQAYLLLIIRIASYKRLVYRSKVMLFPSDTLKHAHVACRLTYTGRHEGAKALGEHRRGSDPTSLLSLCLSHAIRC